MKLNKKIYLMMPLALLSVAAIAQESSDSKIPKFFSYDPQDQVDMADVSRELFFKKIQSKSDTAVLSSADTHTSLLPAAGYSLQTGFAVVLGANLAFYSGGEKSEHISSLLTSVTYSQYKQFIVPLQTNIWSKDGRYNFQSDWRFLKYPSYTYGLGTRTSLCDGYMIDYYYVRLHQNMSRVISKNLYAGIGIDLDFYWDIEELNPDSGKQTDFENYGLHDAETAIGPSFDLLYDSRKNSVNPDQGAYLNISYRPKLRFLGSDANWQSLLIEYKGYKKIPANSDNVVALWSYNWFTFSGKPPYLLLPSTGWDAYVNTGRGFIQGRYRGSDMLYLETEYRFNITSNGLFGGVVFANAETFSSQSSTLAGNASFKTFDPVQPSYGLGIRLKLNKFSKANLCIDYGWGTGGSRGVAVNLGEVF